jgi:hypothetical protein
VSADPPRWAQAVLSLVVPHRTRDSILGDLLEEYREAILPGRGEAAADWWYVRQAAGFLWRASMPWAAFVGLIIGVRDIIDAAVPATDGFHFRAAVCTYLAFSTYALAGFSVGWRSRRALAGLLVSLSMNALAAAIAIGAALIVAALVSLGAVSAAASYEGLAEGLDVPVLPMLIAGGALATIGAAIGKAARRMPRVDVG